MDGPSKDELPNQLPSLYSITFSIPMLFSALKRKLHHWKILIRSCIFDVIDHLSLYSLGLGGQRTRDGKIV